MDLFKPSIYQRLFTGSWALEICSWLVATLVLVALRVLLRQFDSKSLSQWPSRLSKNTIIEALSQLAQGCSLVLTVSGLSQLQWLWYRLEKPLKHISCFEEGSRGVIQSIVPLFKQSMSVVIWFGVFSIFLQALISPLAQQALAIQNAISHMAKPKFHSFYYSKLGRIIVTNRFLLVAPSVPLATAILLYLPSMKLTTMTVRCQQMFTSQRGSNLSLVGPVSLDSHAKGTNARPVDAIAKAKQQARAYHTELISKSN